MLDELEQQVVEVIEDLMVRLEELEQLVSLHVHLKNGHDHKDR